MTYAGRGAWAPVGGTLRMDKAAGHTVPGPYYMRPRGTGGGIAPGVAADDVLLAGSVPDLNIHAVWYGVMAVKVRLQEMIGLVEARDLTLNGRYGTGVRDAIKEFQAATGLTADGIIGPGTAKTLFEPVVHTMGSTSLIGPRIGCGIVTNESAYDPGAVGGSDPRDHGLCQLNADSQGFTLDQSFHVRTAVRQMFGILDQRFTDFGNTRDSVAAYNLGAYGCRLWISEGRPEWFTPLSQRNDPAAKPRNVWAYIDRIQTACTATGTFAA